MKVADTMSPGMASWGWETQSPKSLPTGAWSASFRTVVAFSSIIGSTFKSSTKNIIEMLKCTASKRKLLWNRENIRTIGVDNQLKFLHSIFLTKVLIETVFIGVLIRYF
jgi:hypothetical protein